MQIEVRVEHNELALSRHRLVYLTAIGLDEGDIAEERHDGGLILCSIFQRLVHRLRRYLLDHASWRRAYRQAAPTARCRSDWGSGPLITKGLDSFHRRCSGEFNGLPDYTT